MIALNQKNLGNPMDNQKAACTPFSYVQAAFVYRPLTVNALRRRMRRSSRWRLCAYQSPCGR